MIDRADLRQNLEKLSRVMGQTFHEVVKGQARLITRDCIKRTPPFTGKKGETKEYQHYTKYAGGLKRVNISDVREQRPEDIVSLAVRRMLPKTRLGHDMLRRLKVYPGTEHPHTAQNPQKLTPAKPSK